MFDLPWKRSASSGWRGIARTVLPAVVIGFAASLPAQAQYDSQGRYVPSPMGKPADPYRSYVPLYTGKPGGTKRQSTTPPAYELKPQPLPSFERPIKRRTYGTPSQRPVPTLARCRAGWSKDTGLTPAHFKRLCKALYRNPENGAKSGQ